MTCLHFVDKNNFTTSAFIGKHMNILDAQQMIQIQNHLLSLQNHQNYAFARLDLTLANTIKTFSSALLPIATRQIQEEIQKLVPKTQNIRTVRKDEANSSLKLFTYTVFAIIFPSSKSEGCQQKSRVNHSMLETLKCSLFSKDVNFNQVCNKNLILDSLQAKALIARFLDYMVKESQFSNLERIKFAEWTLQNNILLFELFIRFFRIILFKLGIEGAQDYNKNLEFEETITNLIEYFDISYRSFGELFLISEEQYFLASVGNTLALGDYFQNQRNKARQAQMHLESQGASLSPEEKSKKLSARKSGVIENDVKLFNFLLDSVRSSHILHDNNDMETPHFKDSHDFAFGKKKKEEDQIVRQKQFEKLIMNSDSESVHEFQPERATLNNMGTPPTPYIGQEFAFAAPKNGFDNDVVPQTRHQKVTILKKSTFNDSPIHELEDQNLDLPKMNPEQNRCKNIVSVKDKNFTTFSPQISSSHFKNECFGNYIINDAMFLEQEANLDSYKSSSGRIAEIALPYLNGDCKCGEIRRRRNRIISRVIEFTNLPGNKTPCYTKRTPKLVNNLKFSQNLGFRSPKIRITPPKQKDQEQSIANKEIRKPTFLKFLKKDKQKMDKFSASSKSKNNSIKNISPPANRQKGNRFELDKDTVSKINDKYAKYSTFINKNTFQNRLKDPNSKSTTRKNESESLSKRVPTQQGISIKNFDSKYINARPGLGNNWKSSSNFHQPTPNPNIVEKKPKEQENIFHDKKYEIMKVYAPVHIIAPTVYFNGNYQRDNKVVFKVNDMCGERQKVMQLKESQKIHRTQPSNVNYHDKGMGFYSNKKHI